MSDTLLLTILGAVVTAFGSATGTGLLYALVPRRKTATWHAWAVILASGVLSLILAHYLCGPRLVNLFFEAPAFLTNGLFAVGTAVLGLGCGWLISRTQLVARGPSPRVEEDLLADFRYKAPGAGTAHSGVVGRTYGSRRRTVP